MNDKSPLLNPDQRSLERSHEKSSNCIDGQVCNEQNKKICIGCLIVVLLTFSWAGTQQLSQSAVQVSSFDAPYFMSWFGTCWMMLCFPLYIFFIAIRYRSERDIKIAARDSGNLFSSTTVTTKQFFYRILPMTVLWLATNYMYLYALKFIAVTDASAIFASNAAFVYMLSFCLLGEKLLLIRVLACLFSISGVVLFAYSYGFQGGSQLLAGALLAAATAFGAAFYKVIFKLWVGDASLGQVSLFLTLIGLCNTLFFWTIFLVLYLTRVEYFVGSDIPWVELIISSLLGLVFNSTLSFGVAFTYPLFISVSLMLGIPLNAVLDVFFKGVSFTFAQIIAAIAIIVGFCMMLLPEHLNEPIHHILLCKCQRNEPTRPTGPTSCNADGNVQEDERIGNFSR